MAPIGIQDFFTSRGLETFASECRWLWVLFLPVLTLATVRPGPAFTTWAELLAAGDAFSVSHLDAVTADLDIDDAINIQYTSGTTGFPKAVVLTHHNILNNAYFTALERLGDPR